MKALTNLIFIVLLTLSAPVFLFIMYSKTYASKGAETSAKKPSSVIYEVQIKNAEIARLKKENAELKARIQSPLSRPPRPFGQGAQYTDSNSQSPLSRPPRRVGADYEFREANEALRSVEYHDE
jgi:hypothetical protein